MTYLLWHREWDARIASSRRVLRAAEVPLLQEAQQVRDACLSMAEAERRRAAGAAQDARARAEAERVEARRQGFAEGFADGQRKSRDALARQLEALARASAEQRERLQRSVAALALQVARKLLGRLGDDAVLAALADTAAADALAAPPLALGVHPDQADAVRARLAAAARDGEGALRCEVRADAALARDACVLETEHGRIDASLDAQLARLAAAWDVGGDEERAS